MAHVTPSGPPRLLIVEPNRSALGVMSKRLGEAGYRVIACDQPANAMAELHRFHVDLMIAELRMAPVDGIALTRMIREDYSLCELPVILITGRSDRNGAVAGFGCGADDVVAKPFHFEVLEARIAARLARARSLDELKRDNATLDARVVERAIQLGELKLELQERDRQLRSLRR